MKTTTPDPRARRASRRVRFADEKGEREDDAWIVDDDSESTTTATRARSSANERVECVERVESVSRVPSPTTTPRAKVGESTSSAVKDRVAAFEEGPVPPQVRQAYSALGPCCPDDAGAAWAPDSAR